MGQMDANEKAHLAREFAEGYQSFMSMQSGMTQEDLIRQFDLQCRLGGSLLEAMFIKFAQRVNDDQDLVPRQTR